MKRVRVYIFGDSHVYGAWDSQGGWCDRIKRKAHALSLDESQDVKCQVFNLGIGGDSSRSLRVRMKSEIEARHRPDWTPIIVIGVGVNDTRYDGGSQLPVVPIEEYRSNMEALIATARVYTDQVVLLGLPLTQHEVQPFKDSYFNHELLQAYDQVITRLAEQHSLVKIELNEYVLAGQESVYVPDGVHLNDRGHEIIADHIWAALTEIIKT